MAFSDALTFVSGYCTTRADQLTGGDRLTWALSGDSFKAAVDDMFDRTVERDEWDALYAQKQPDLNLLIGVRSKIAWMAGCNRDLRTQYACSSECRMRTPQDQSCTAALQLRWMERGLQRMRDLLLVERAKPIGTTTTTTVATTTGDG